MPRGPRISYPHAIFHVINRFVDRHPFFRSKADYTKFLDIYFDVAQTFDIWTYAYDLMPNHFHIVLETPSGEISRFLQRFLTRAVQYLNHKHDRIGHLLQGRTKTLLIERDSYFSAVMGYVLLNRVRAGLSRNIFTDEYNSVQDMLTTGPSRLARGPLWENIFGHTFDERNKRFELGLCRNWLRELDVHDNREKFLSGHRGSFLGSREFRREILKVKERRQTTRSTGLRRKTDLPRKNWTYPEIVAACKSVIAAEGWKGKWKNRDIAVRQLSWFVASIGACWPYEKIRSSLEDTGIPHSRYTMAINRIRSSPEKLTSALSAIELLSSPTRESVKVSE